MKQAIIIPALTLSFGLANVPCISHNSDERIEATITPNLQYADLEKIKLDLLQKGITIEYLSLEFGQNKLNKIRLAVDC